MDLAQWEAWLDRYTGTRQEDGSLDLLLDGEQFFPRLRQAIAQATNHIHFDLYIFDRDDVAVGVADQLKQRSRQIEVKVILDRLGSIGAGLVPPGTPAAGGFRLPQLDLLLPAGTIPAFACGPSSIPGSRPTTRRCSWWTAPMRGWAA